MESMICCAKDWNCSTSSVGKYNPESVQNWDLNILQCHIPFKENFEVLELHVKIRLLLLAAMHSLLTQPENAALIKQTLQW